MHLPAFTELPLDEQLVTLAMLVLIVVLFSYRGEESNQ